ncbi:unnamed protein product, partial [marine sediment metagenome]
VEERQKTLIQLFDLTKEETELLQNFGYFNSSQQDKMIENVIGSYQLPMGLACNFKINNKDYLIPMVIEEPSVVAAASNSARFARKHGGFQSEEVKSIMISQIQITQVDDVEKAKQKLLEHKEEIIKIANDQDPFLNELGGGAFDFEIRELSTRRGDMIILHLLVNVLDAMGANVVNTMAEAVSPYIEELCQGRIYLRILSNLATHRIARSRAVFDKELLGGEEVVEGIMLAYEFAYADPYRATTHNKG